jgi:predicted negative regulator of RcsB-dependent stress response
VRRRIFPWILILLIAVGGAFLWTNYQSVSKFPVAAQPSAEPSTPREVADDKARQALAALQQTVKDLQTSQQDAAEKISKLQQQISAEQGHRKLLSEQVGALSARFHNFLDTNAQAPATSPQPAKKRGPQ